MARFAACSSSVGSATQALLLLVWSLGALAIEPRNCSCGYFDSETRNIFTDSVIVYFNETSTLPADDVLAESYVNKHEQGWNSVFRQGADPSNVIIQKDTSATENGTPSLQLAVSPTTAEHLVIGGGIRTLRQDILYGSFRAMMKSPGPYKGGTSLSMMLQFNQSSRITANLQNGDVPSNAWMSTLVGSEFPDISLGVNYTNLSSPDGDYGAANPWGFNEIKVDWTPENVNYFINNHPMRMVNASSINSAQRPETPAPFTIKHWSVGDAYAMYGPPQHDSSTAGVLWVRLFFNTSSMTADARASFDHICAGVTACAVDDMALRGSTPYLPEALHAYAPPDSGYQVRWWAVGLGSFALAISMIVLLNVFLRNVFIRAAKPLHSNLAAEPYSTQQDSDLSTLALRSGATTPVTAQCGPLSPDYAVSALPTFPRDLWSTPSSCTTLTSSTPPGLTRSPTPSPIFTDAKRKVTGIAETMSQPQSMTDLLIQQMPLPPHSRRSPSPRALSALRREPRTMSLLSSTSGGSTRAGSFLGRAVEGISYGPAMPIEDLGREEIARNGIPESRTTTMMGSESSIMMSPPLSPKSPAPLSPKENEKSDRPAPTAPRTRIDYLAGLVGVCSILVSLTHFMLTFVPATIEPGAFAHYDSELWASRTIGPFFFNEVWVVIFFTTSTRFLTTKYLRSGDLAAIAEKVVGRVFRLMVPITGIILLEYFLMDVGAINWLQYLPSISWSTWVYTTVFPDFGSFINEALELVYIIPNAMPAITFNYCTGVLWTIPVQIQGSWQAMLGVIVIREIKTPWKRFGYYAFCILSHWYARSWGSFFMAGLLLADLDITFKYRKWLRARPLVYYPLLNLAILLTLLALGNDLTTTWTGFSLATTEAGWHPSQVTGRFRIQEGEVPFPPYYFPTLNGLIFAVGAQLVVEWSQWVQCVMATKVFLWLFPHIFTIYLFHGFIFWSVGAWICVGLAGWSIPYWANVLFTCIGSYLTLFACLPLVTPVVEALGKTITANIWQAASEQPPKKRPTLFPFPRDLFTCRGPNCGGSDDGSSLTAGPSS